MHFEQADGKARHTRRTLRHRQTGFARAAVRYPKLEAQCLAAGASKTNDGAVEDGGLLRRWSALRQARRFRQDLEVERPVAPKCA
jgi:hypothetical protein